jgi:hypothetical protein
MLNFVATSGDLNGQRFTAKLVKERVGEKAAGMQKKYTVNMLVDGEAAGHVTFKAMATPGTVKGIKSAAVEFDNIGFAGNFKSKKLSYVLIWAAAFEAIRKGYRSGTVKSIMTVGSYGTFAGAGFAAIKGATDKDQAKIDGLKNNKLLEVEDRVVYRTDEELLAESGDVSLTTIMGMCAAKIQERTGSIPSAS